MYRVANRHKDNIRNGVGTVIGTSLTKDSLVDLHYIKPAILITFTLVITGLAIGLWTNSCSIQMVTILGVFQEVLAG